MGGEAPQAPFAMFIHSPLVSLTVYFLNADAWKFSDIGIQEGMYKRIYIGRDGKRYAIIALKPRSYKQPIQSIGLEDGKRYQCGKGFIREWTDMYYAETLDAEE